MQKRIERMREKTEELKYFEKCKKKEERIREKENKTEFLAIEKERKNETDRNDGNMSRKRK